ncbi:MAG: galactose-1-phosphate uridylyltransferase [Elusimicrobiales bacterium]
MNKLGLTKPDGRYMFLYSRREIPRELRAPSPDGTPVRADPHLRWHPLRGEWVAYASHRNNRTFLPPPEYNPLAPSRPGDFPTELPAGEYDAAVFENRFPSMAPGATAKPDVGVPSRPADGVCEVVVFTQDPKASLSGLELEHLELLIDVWADRYAEISARKNIQYIMPFENRGVEMGVTLHHPHGQIYAYPFVPPVPARELELQREHLQQHGRGLLEDMAAAEIAGGGRVVAVTESAAAFVPVCARYPYEVWVMPRRAAPSFAALDARERKDLARTLKTVLMKYDALWQRPFPYLMVFHQSPVNTREYPEAHLHAQIYPALRSPGRLKYLAGTELGAGMFANDCLPEEKAAELQAVKVNV